MGVIAIKHLELTGTGDEFYPLGGSAVQCIVLDRSGNTTIDVPAAVCIRGHVAGSLVLTGTGNVSQCGDLSVWKFDADALNGDFDQSNYGIEFRTICVDMGYVSKRFVESGDGTASTSVWEVIQDSRHFMRMI